MAEGEGTSDFFAQHYLRPKRNQDVTQAKRLVKTTSTWLFSYAQIEEFVKIESAVLSEAVAMAAKKDPERSGVIFNGIDLIFDDDYEEIPVTSIHWSYLKNKRRFPRNWDYDLDLSENQGILSTIMAGNPSTHIDNFVAIPEEDMKLLTQRTGMPIVQQNGQRKYGPPRDYDGPEPMKGSEVFIGKLPRDLFEPDIVRVCETVGRIYEIRMMMDFSGTNRGYCFVKYFTPEEATRAVAELNNFEIKKGRTIGVLISVDNCRLFLGGIPRTKTEAEIFDEVSKVTDGVRRVISYPSAEDKTKNRGFAFVEYESHRAAAMARRKLLPKRIPMWGEFLQVDWAEPLPDVNPSIMEKVTKLYVRNLSLDTTEEQLMERFNECSQNGVERVKKIKDFAFVHFASREQADTARNTLDRTEMDGCLIDIEWAKPPEDTYKAKKALARQPRQHYQREPPGFIRGNLFNGYHHDMAVGHTRYSNMNMQQTHEGVPLGHGLPSYEIEALEAAFAAQRFFAPRVMKPRENNRGRAAAGIQNFHLSEAVIQQQRRVYQYPDSASASGGYMPDQYMHSGFYPYPVYPQELHQQFSQEISHNY